MNVATTVFKNIVSDAIIYFQRMMRIIKFSRVQRMMISKLGFRSSDLGMDEEG